ncbi:MAG: hypothetical protein Q8P46_15005 [Hyphomicrobiales bacterium]|nr:hypothetical protein [Hyphomicrobiales bacterium]
MNPTPVATFSCIDPSSIPERIASSPDPFVVLIVAVPLILVWLAVGHYALALRRAARQLAQLTVEQAVA